TELLRPGDPPPSLREELPVERLREGAVAFVARLPHLGAQRLAHVLPHEGAHLVTPGALLRRELVAHQELTTRRTWTTSMVPCSPISRLMRKVKSETSTPASNAATQPCTSKPRTTSEASFSMPAFTTSVNSPSVRMLSGSVKSSTSGRTNAFRMPIVAAANSSDATL